MLLSGEKMWDWFLKRTGIINRPWFNRRHWKNYLRREAGSPVEKVGCDWGNPEASDDYYGNYREVLRRLQENISPGAQVVEIGSYGGKWTQYMTGAGRVTCVDLFEESFEFLKKRLEGKCTLEFYKTSGDELKGIASDSADLVFSMDSFVRMPPRAVQGYFFEIFRVLKNGGKVLIHLPANDIPFCRRKKFTDISLDWIRNTAAVAGFKNFQLDDSVLKHGILFYAQKLGL